jgi:hypothetical protein
MSWDFLKIDFVFLIVLKLHYRDQLDCLDWQPQRTQRGYQCRHLSIRNGIRETTTLSVRPCQSDNAE